MKSLKPQLKVSMFALALLSVTACGYSGKSGGGYYYSGHSYEQTYSYNNPISKPADNNQSKSQPKSDYENPFVNVSQDNTNNISLTSSTFAYPTIREELNGNRYYNVKPMVKTEEMLNYFSYGYVNDTDDALTAKLELDKCPWNNNHYLASVVVKAKPAVTENVKNNIVILVDKSGSMSPVMSLVKTSLKTLVEAIGDDDVVSIVSYASGCKVECEGKTGAAKNSLNTVIDSLKASGSTNGEAGIETAYDVAYKYFIPEGNNRVVILTDGDFNVGKTTGEELTKLIKKNAADGVYLTCCGYRSYDNDTLYTLANNGNGNAYYIDGELEAKKVFEQEIGKSLFVAAKDAKCQVQFSDRVKSYRLLGYESRQITDQEFDNTRKDAGEIMSDHTTVALYELVLNNNNVHQDNYYFKANLHYKDPITEESKEVSATKEDISVSRKVDFEFAGYVAEFALILSESKYKANSSYSHLLEIIDSEAINDKYRDDFVALVNKAKTLSERA